MLHRHVGVISALVLLLAAQASFAQPLAAPVSAKPGRVAVADMNGDRKPDIVAGCERAICILLGDGKGNLREVSRTPVNGQPTEIAIADFTGDGVPDVAFADHDTLFVFLLAGDGHGGLRPLGHTRSRPTGKPHIHGLLAGDWDRDGKADLAHFNIAESEIVLLTGDGRGEMSRVKAIASNHPNNPIGMDLNGDGILDLAIPNTERGTVTILLGDGKGAFSEAPGSPHRTAQRPYYIAAGDWNRDGFFDLAVSHDDISTIGIFLGDGLGGFRAGDPLDATMTVYGVAFAGADLVAVRDRHVIVFRRDKDGRVSRTVAAKPNGAWWAVLADMDMDGRPDLIDVSSETREIRIFRDVLAQK